MILTLIIPGDICRACNFQPFKGGTVPMAKPVSDTVREALNHLAEVRP